MCDIRILKRSLIEYWYRDDHGVWWSYEDGTDTPEYWYCEDHGVWWPYEDGTATPAECPMVSRERRNQ